MRSVLSLTASVNSVDSCASKSNSNNLPRMPTLPTPVFYSYISGHVIDRHLRFASVEVFRVIILLISLLLLLS